MKCATKHATRTGMTIAPHLGSCTPLTRALTRSCRGVSWGWNGISNCTFVYFTTVDAFFAAVRHLRSDSVRSRPRSVFQGDRALDPRVRGEVNGDIFCYAQIHNHSKAAQLLNPYSTQVRFFGSIPGGFSLWGFTGYHVHGPLPRNGETTLSDPKPLGFY